MKKSEPGDARQETEFSAEVSRLRMELATTREQVRALQGQLESVKSLHEVSSQEAAALQRRLQFAEERAREAAVRLEEMLESPSWRLLKRISETRILAGLWRGLKAMSPLWLKQEIKARLRTLGLKQTSDGVSAESFSTVERGRVFDAGASWASETHVQEALVEFLTRVDRTRAPNFVVFVAGVKFVESEGQRVTQLIREFIRNRTPVLLIYFRWRSEYHQTVPCPHDPVFFQIPMDLFDRCRKQVIDYPFDSLICRTCIFEFPHPWTSRWIEELNQSGWDTVYDVIDDWPSFHKAGKALWYEHKVERQLCEKCTSVTAVTPALAERARGLGHQRDVEVVPNGVSLDSFDESQPPATAPRGEVTVGYFGFFTPAWFDWKLVRETARKRPTWQFHVVGFGEPVPFELPGNVHLLGRVSHHLLYAYAKNWSVAMVPFRSNQITRSSDPIKVYEYLALGLPVVVTNLEQLRSYPGVFVANSGEEFGQLLEKAAAEGLDGAKVKPFLDRSTWAQRGLALVEAGRRRSQPHVTEQR